LPGKPVRAYMVRSEGGASQEIFPRDGEQSVPSWSPDGATIAVALNADPPPSPEAPRGIYLIDWKTQRTQKIPGSEGLTSPMWSPNGKYFIAKTVDEHAILLFNPRTQRWNEIVNDRALSGVTWSKDSSYLYFQKFLTPGQPVFRMRMRDLKAEQMLSFESELTSGVEACVLLGLAQDGSLLIRLKRAGSHVYALDLELP